MLPSTLATFCGTQEAINKSNILQNSRNFKKCPESFKRFLDYK